MPLTAARHVCPVVVRHKEIRPLVVESMPIDRDVRTPRVEMRCLDAAHVAPRRDARRRDVGPRLRAVAREPHEPVVRAGPHDVRIARRRGERVHDAAWFSRRGVGRRRGIERRRNAGVRTRQISAHHVPRVAAVARAKDDLVRIVERFVRTEHERQRPLVAPRTRPPGGGRYRARLAREQILAYDFSAEDDVCIRRIRRKVAVLVTGHDRSPIARFDTAMVAARDDRRRTAILLRAIQAIWKRIVGRDVIELPGRLIEPRRPRARTVDAHARALVAREHHLRPVGRIDPQLVKVVSIRRSLDRLDVNAGIGRTIDAGVGDVDEVCILRIDRHVTEIPTAIPEPCIGVCEHPRDARIVATIKPTRLRVDDRVHAIRFARCDGEPDLAKALVWKPAAHDLFPR